jgi:hypothetical protein
VRSVAVGTMQSGGGVLGVGLEPGAGVLSHRDPPDRLGQSEVPGTKERDMTTKAAFSPEEWKVVLEGPPTAGMIVITAARGGMFRETVAMSKAYTEARAEHGDSELLDEIVAAKPQMDHTRYHSAEELRDNGLRHLRDAVALVDSKATTQERDDYRRFALTLANKVAAAHKEGGQSVSPAEAEAIQQITAALSTASS